MNLDLIIVRSDMRILFLISVINGGGAARVMTNLANMFYKHGDEVILVSTLATSSDYDTEKGVTRITLQNDHEKEKKELTLIRNIKLIYRLNHILKTTRPDVAISFMAEPNFRLLMCSNHVKKIISIRNDPKKEYKGIRGWITRSLFSRADGIVCQTDDVVKWLPRSLKPRSIVIMNQVKEVFYTTPRTGAEYYIATGRLDAQKNYFLLLEAFHDFAITHPHAILRIYGNGPLRNDLENKVKEYGDENKIFFMGATSAVADVLSHAKAFILTSDYEGMPNGLLEAMAMGLPCVSTDCPCGGPQMVIENNVNGILIPVRDKRALVNALSLIEDDALYADSIAQKAKERAQCFAPETIFEKWYSYVTHAVKFS